MDLSSIISNNENKCVLLKRLIVGMYSYILNSRPSRHEYEAD